MKHYLIIPLLMLTSVCFTQNYYVAPDGDDNSGNGSINAPFATMEKACEYVMPGDTVFMRGGIYNTEQRINHEKDGTADNPIVFMAYQGEEPIIDGTDISLSNNGCLLFLARWNDNPVMSYIVVDGITVQNSSERGISYYKTDYLTIKNCKVYNIQKRAVGGFGHYINIENNEIHHAGLINENGVMGSSGWPMMIYSAVDYDTGDPSQHIVIKNNFVHQSWGEGIGPGQGTDNVLIEGNTVKDVWSVGIYCDKTTNAVIRNNHIYNTDPTFYRFDEPAVGISMANEISFQSQYHPIQNISIYNNLVVNVRNGIGFWFDSSNSEPENNYSDIFIANNVIYNPTSFGIYIDEVPEGNNQPGGCRLHDNIIGFGQWQSEIADLDAWQISHNNWLTELPNFAGNAAISADPLFENPGIESNPEGFLLTVGSPCIGAGTNLLEVSTDFWGASRLSPPSIGIHAYGSTVGISSDNNGNVWVYPNPTNNNIFIQINDFNSQAHLIRIYDISGKSVYKESVQDKDIEINIQDLPKGLYILQIQTGIENYAERIIVH